MQALGMESDKFLCFAAMGALFKWMEREGWGLFAEKSMQIVWKVPDGKTLMNMKTILHLELREVIIPFSESLQDKRRCKATSCKSFATLVSS